MYGEELVRIQAVGVAAAHTERCEKIICDLLPACVIREGRKDTAHNCNREEFRVTIPPPRRCFSPSKFNPSVEAKDEGRRTHLDR